jgi:short-subunit dehydrogenase
MADHVALITGASSGIGWELAKLFAKGGARLALVARSTDRLEALAKEIVAEHPAAAPPLVIDCDLSRPDAGDVISAALKAADVEVEYLVNNAGYGLLGDAIALDRADQLAMIDLNVRALTDLSLRFADQLVRHKGGLLNVASVAAFMPGPRMAVYYATKAYVLSLTEALQSELAPRGVRVSALCPGPVRTGFQKRAGVASELNAGMVVSVEDVARAGYDGLMAGRAIVLPGFPMKALVLAVRLLPRSFVVRMIHRSQRRRKTA